MNQKKMGVGQVLLLRRQVEARRINGSFAILI
jgi:hypothetical protein